MNDTQLLESFAKDRSETAFRTLVERYLPLVLGTARRITRDNALAEDVAQTVFILLSRKASGFRSGTIVSGWLYRTTRFVASRALCSEQRRRRRETQAADMHENHSPDPLWERVTPHLDDALGRLGETDRNAILLRFFKQQPMREIGVALGTSEEAAKKRVARAVEKLRGILSRRGTEISAALLVAGLSHEYAQASTAELISKISRVVTAKAAAGAGVGGGAALLLAEVLSAMRWFQIKVAMLAFVGTAILLFTLSPLRQQWRDSDAPVPKITQVANAGGSARLLARKNASTNDDATTPFHNLQITVLDQKTGLPIANAEAIQPLLIRGADWSKRPAPPRTDTNGIVRLLVPKAIPEGERMDQFEVWLQAEGYAPREIHWLSTTGNVLGIVTSDYTVRLEPGITLAGIVVDEAGQPLANVRVGGYGSNYRGYTVGNAEVRIEDFANITMPTDKRTNITDGAGHFEIAHFPSDLRALLIEVMTPEGVQGKFLTPAGKSLTADETTEIGFDDLKRGTARLVVSKGVTVNGIVVNSAGEPVKDAEVIEATQWGNLKILSRNRTDEGGRFQLVNRPVRELIIAASAEGYASVSTVAVIKPEMEPLRIQLPPELPLRGRLLDESGQAVTSAEVKVVDVLNEGLGFAWASKTDGEGRFSWRAAPTNQLGFMIWKDNLYKCARLTASTNEQVVVMRERKSIVRVTGKVFDAETKAPIDSFKVKMSHGMSGDTPQTPEQTVKGNEGSFEIEMDQAKMPVGIHAAWILTIESKDYESDISRMYGFEEGDQELEFALKPGGWIQGIVRTPAGDPAAYGQMQLGMVANAATSTQEGQINQNGNPSSSTDSSGHFKLKKIPKSTGLVVFHESGWAVVSPSAFASDLEVSLQPWGRIEGTLLRGKERHVGESIGLKKLVWDFTDPIAIYHSAKVGEDGQFVFQKLPAGEYQVYMLASDLHAADETLISTLQTPVSVQAGETKSVVLGSSGRSAVARMQAPPGIVHPVWTNAVAILRRDVPIPAEPSRSLFVSNESHRDARIALAHEPAMRAALREIRDYAGHVASDGTVGFENIPPGRYLMEVTLFTGKKSRTGMQRSEIAGQTRVAVFISEADGNSESTPVSLGAIPLEGF